MKPYYLIAQLPSLDGVGDTAPLPITYEYFSELCHRFLEKKALLALESLTLLPNRDPTPKNDPVLDAWNTHERQLRLALGRVRSRRLQKPFDGAEASIPASLLQAATTASGQSDPLAAELFLHRIRLDFLETLRPKDPFSLSYLFYYGLKLKLLMRIRRFDTKQGQAAYQHIYASVLDGGRQEATQ